LPIGASQSGPSQRSDRSKIREKVQEELGTSDSQVEFAERVSIRTLVKG
jgi:hypothetical protein